MAEVSRLRKRIGRVAREVIAPLTWCYVVIKLVLFDIDSAALRMVAPQYLWVLGYKFFVFLGAVLLLLLLLGRREFLFLVAFVLGYPFVLVLWKLPKRFYRQWPLTVVFLPAIVETARRLWSTVLLYSLAALGALLILGSGSRLLLVFVVACLIPLLIVHLGRSLRKAYATSLLTRLTGWADKLRNAIESGTFVPWHGKVASDSSSANSSGPVATSPRQVAYSFHWLADFIADRVKAVAKRRYYDLYLLASWFYTVVLTAVLFAFAHLGLERAFPGAYGDVEGAGFWSFLGYSLGILTTSNVSKISPVSVMAKVASYAEVVCSIIILVILVFSIMTAAREAFREDLDGFSAALARVATALEDRIRAEWQLTAVGLERVLLAENPSLVNWLRKLKGLPELDLPGRRTECTTPDGGDTAQQQA
jgi:hypothetical protein